MTIDATGAALVIAAIGGSGALVTALGTFVLQWRADTRKAKKDAKDDLAREHAREVQQAAMQALTDEQRATKHLVDGHNTVLTGEVVALKDAISKRKKIPTMKADDAAPAQVTKDGDVVSVGKEKKEKPE